MASHALLGRRLLVVEDEYLLADDMRLNLEDAGAVVVGPVGSLSEALSLIAKEELLDGAILDVNLGGEKSFAVADHLMARGVPLIFATGYDEAALPSRYRDIPRCGKPINLDEMAHGIGKQIEIAKEEGASGQALANRRQIE
jgi:CheY-like chemotaxis protein